MATVIITVNIETSKPVTELDSLSQEIDDLGEAIESLAYENPWVESIEAINFEIELDD